jgi:cytochrome c-type biogenesis protein CcmH/NrfG
MTYIFYICRLNRLEESVSAYNDALRIDPFFVEAYNGRGNTLMDFGHEQGNVLGR